MTRLQRLIEALPQELDGLYVTNERNIFYLTGFDYTDGYLLVTREKSYLMTDFRYIEAAKEQAGKEWNVTQFSGRRADQVGAFLSENHVKTLGFEGASLSFAQYEALKADFKEIILKSAVGIVESLREYKDEGELDDIIAAQRIAEKAFDSLLGFINTDRTETEVALELEYTMRRLGAQGSAFDIIAVSGSASSRPHGVPRDVKLEKGLFTLDFGAIVKNYRSDMTRTICIGKPDEDTVKLYNTVLEAQMAVLNSVHEGGKLAELDKIARNITDREYKGCFGHGLGHGVGLDIHEAPGVSGGAGEKRLTRGHVITVEPGIYLEGRFGARIEDMVVCGKNGAVDITNCPKQLIVL